jgi:predicted TIM-barrel fold metal-dependent hydrolase
MQYYNVHSHVFTMNNAPDNFLSLFMSDGMADLVDTITNTKAGSATVEWLLNRLGGDLGRRYASFLGIGKSRDQLEVFEILRKQYDDAAMRFIVLSMFMEECGAGMSLSGYEGQIEQLLTIKKQYPDHMLIFLGLDPRWKGGGARLRRWVEDYFERRVTVNGIRSVYPFVGLKLYPSTGFYAFDERLKETFEWAADNGVPVLSHCNYMGGIFNNVTSYLKANLDCFDPYTGKMYSAQVPNRPSYINASASFWQRIMGTANTKSNMRSCSYFLEPESYRTMVDYFSKKGKPLKICLAHFGGSNQITVSNGSKHQNDKEELNPYGVLRKNWYQQILALMRQYPNIYSDVSYAIYDKAVFEDVFTVLNEAGVGDRIMFGTDFFLTEREQEEKLTVTNFRTEAMKDSRRIGRLNNAPAWDIIASSNTHDFLSKGNKYYPGNVL